MRPIFTPETKLLEPSGRTIAVENVRDYRADLIAYNLDVTGIHTYYALAGTAPVLVHNSCGTVYRVIRPGLAGRIWAADMRCRDDRT
jgi:hypothetical protein